MTATTDDRTIRPFAAILQELAKGTVHTELSTALADLMVAVQEHQKKGSITLKLTVEPKGDAYSVSSDITVAAPKAKPSSIFFADDSGNLTRSDPRQEAFELHDVAKKGQTA